MSLASETRRPGRGVEIAVLLAILTVAAFFRFAQLDAVPPGMTHDEAAFGAEAEQILEGERPLYFALGYGHEPAYAYLVAAAFALLGRTLIAIRVASAVCGLLVVLGTYALARQMFGVRAAWVSAALMAVAFWPVSLSRQALRAITLPLLWLPAAWWFGNGLRVAGDRGRVSDLESGALERAPVGARGAWKWRVWACGLVAGLLLGGTFYTYMASRVTWVVIPAFALYLLLFKSTRAALVRVWPVVLTTLVVAGLVGLPLFAYLRAHPGAEKRFGDMMEPIRELLASKPGRVLRHTWNALRVFSWIGDRFWAYNIPGRPILDWVGSVLFYVGLLVAIWRWRTPSYAFLLIWLLVGLLPAMVTTNEGIFLRAIVAQPAAYLLVAVGFQTAASVADSALDRLRFAVPRRWIAAAWGVAALGLVVWEGGRTVRSYLIDWPSRPQARNIYNHNMVAIARHLGEEPESEPGEGAIGIAALYPLYYHDPWIWRYVAERDDLAVRWFGGLVPYPSGCIVYPGQGEARYVFSALTQLDPTLRRWFEGHATMIERVELDAADQNPYFEVWRWRGHDALVKRLEELRAVSPMWIEPELRQSLEGPAQFGDVMALLGYELNGRAFRPGDNVELVTYWRALRTVQGQDDWVTFLHLLDETGQMVAGMDVWHCPPTGWQPGDVAVQVHRFQVPDDVPRQEVMVEMGVYRRTVGRLPVVVGGQAVADRILLIPVRIQ